MGSTLGSILQGIGQTGEDIGKADISNQVMQHQFTMDYLANQARQRQLDLEQSGQQQQFKLATGAQNIEQQRLNQSRWQLMPGYNKIPDPDNPGSYQYQHTFLDPITGQKTFYNSDSPPPGSPEYIMNSFQYLTKQAKDMGIDVPLNARLSAAGMKVDTEDAIANKYHNYWLQMQDAAKSDKSAQAVINKRYPGGEADYIDQSVKDEHGGLSAQAHIDALMQGLTWGGNNRSFNTADATLVKSLNQTLGHYATIISNANADVQKYGTAGAMFNPDKVAAASSLGKDAWAKYQTYAAQLDQIYGRMNPQSPVNPNAPDTGTVVNPPINPIIKPVHQVGDSVSIGGKTMKVTAVHDDGSFDAK